MNKFKLPVVKVFAKKNSTGEQRLSILGEKHPLITRIGAENIEDLVYYMHFELGENNWSCDCNRCHFFEEYEVFDYPGCQEEEYAVEWFEVDGKTYYANDDYGTSFEYSKFPTEK